MDAEIVNRFLNQRVKLVKEGYALYGTIIEVKDDCLLFQTKTAVSVIRLDVIHEITPIERGNQ